jgi:SAM-dependent methyltransferase
MAERVDLFDSTYRHFTDRVLDTVRKETFGDDIGQNSWLTVDEYDRFLGWLDLSADQHVLEVASGSGGPALYLARTQACHVTGIDVNLSGVTTAAKMTAEAGEARRVRFCVADAGANLPFADGAFDGLLCIDSMNHLPDRRAVLQEWQRVLRNGRRALFTDPVVISGPVTNDELALRSSIGLFLFVPPGANEQLIEQAGLRLVRQEDVTDNAALVSGRWIQARQEHRDELIRIEGVQRFEGLQRFFETVHNLTGQRRLSRIAYLVEKRR